MELWLLSLNGEIKGIKWSYGYLSLNGELKGIKWSYG